MKKQLGELLVQREWLTREQLSQALKHQQVFGGRLGSCLLELALIGEDRLGKALSDQLGAPLATADDLRVIADGVLELIPAKLACRAKVVPFERFGNSVSVAMLDTRDLLLQDELGFVVSKRLRVHVASEIRILEALDKHYHCGVEQRYGRIWDRLNRSRFLWQEDGAAGGGQPARRAEPAAPGPAVSPGWEPAPPPPLESGVTRLSSLGAAVQAAPAATATDVLPPPPPPPPPLAPPPRSAAPPPHSTAVEAPTPAPLRAAPPPPPPPPTPAPAAAATPPPVAGPAAPPAPPRPAPPTSLPPAAAPPRVATSPPAAAAPRTPASRPRDDEATSPLVVPPPAGTLEQLRQRLAHVDERDDVAYAALSFLERRVARRLLFMVRGSEVTAWMGSGEGVDQRALSELSFHFDEPSLFLNLREGSPFYRGPLPRLDAHQRLVKSWGGKYPRECLLLPVRVKKRLVAVVYSDRAAEGLGGVDIEEMQALAAAMGHALEAFLRKKKGAG